jgi:hypothetical protein
LKRRFALSKGVALISLEPSTLAETAIPVITWRKHGGGVAEKHNIHHQREVNNHNIYFHTISS